MVGIRVVVNVQDTSSRTLRSALLLATLCIFITGLAVPHAFGSGLAGWTLAGTVAVLLAVLCAVESRARGTLESA